MAKAIKPKKPADLNPAPAGYEHESGAPAPVKNVPAGYEAE